MNSAAQLALGITIGKGASSLFLGQRDGVRLQEKFADCASGCDAVAVVAAQQFDHRVAVRDDSLMLFGCDLDIIVGAAGFDTGTSIDPRAGSRVTSKMCFEQRHRVNHYP